MARGVLGVLAGAVVWMTGFLALAMLTSVLWPNYAGHGRTYMAEGIFSFSPLMACFNLVFWMFADFGAGWTAMKIAQRRGTVWTLAALLGIYVAALHLFFYWPTFPWWYNLGVVIPAIPATLLGANLAATRSKLSTP